MNTAFKLLVFDWDGTLMDSEAVIVDCVQAAAIDLGRESPDVDQVRNIIGLGLREAVSTLFPDMDESFLQGMVDRYRYHFLHEGRAPSELFSGVEEAIEALEAAGYLLAVATGKGRRGLDAALRHTGLDVHFQSSRCADECHSKPHPEMLLQLMDEFGVLPLETLMIGDTEYDLEMAGNAGVPSLAVSYGVHEVERLFRHAPLACLDSISELPGWLSGVSPVKMQGPG